MVISDSRTGFCSPRNRILGPIPNSHSKIRLAANSAVTTMVIPLKVSLQSRGFGPIIKLASFKVPKGGAKNTFLGTASFQSELDQ